MEKGKRRQVAALQIRGRRVVQFVCGTAVFLVLAAAPLMPGFSDETESPSVAEGKQAPASSEATIDPLSVNASCYVCHIPFVREEISRVHFAGGVTCIKCHGLSAAHANDEDIGATKPDITFGRKQVDKMCAKCHKTHDVPARDVLARFVERKLTDKAAVCTDCHGHHRIEVPEEEGDEG